MQEQDKPKRTLDCVGLFCPEPLYQTRKNMDALSVGEVLEVLADDPTAAEDITRFATRAGHKVIAFENTDGQLRFLIRKGK
ncbi:MAG: sulfurtransferase TusA family protein [Deltaproteobacteria bacterium]|nr:sulfurtransferase TusA family protein [Deltaproteobacteria bacterium]